MDGVGSLSPFTCTFATRVEQLHIESSRTLRHSIHGKVLPMTSEERHAARRKRREIARKEKRQKAVAPYDCYENVISAQSLLRAARQSKKTVAWKASVQRYMANLLRNTWDLRKRLLNGISVAMGFICFTLCERGKMRHIRSVHFKERVVQRSVCDNALVPVLGRSLVYENGASMKGKGIHFHVFLCSRQLHRFYRQNHFSNEGWILQIDFSGYFDNIQHPPLKQMILQAFQDRRLRWLIWQFVKSFGKESLGIGSQVSQILAVSYPNRIDHYAREVLGLNLSGRYMDDSYYMHASREYLQYCLEKMRPMFDELGIRLNPRKTQIIPIKRFTFLKTRFYLTEKGKVVLKPCAASITRNRRKLKAFSRMLESGEMTIEGIINSYASWYGYQNHLDAHKSLREMDKLFYELFHIWPTHRKKRKRKVFYR